jgi:hypothetical protein
MIQKEEIGKLVSLQGQKLLKLRLKIIFISKMVEYQGRPSTEVVP